MYATREVLMAKVLLDPVHYCKVFGVTVPLMRIMMTTTTMPIPRMKRICPGTTRTIPGLYC